MSEFGYKIKNISAAMLYEVNLGTREYFTYTEAMLNNSLFSDFLLKAGMEVYKDGTRDIICLDYDFGSRSFEDEKKRLTSKLKRATDWESAERLRQALAKVEENQSLYSPKKRDEIREFFYENGVDIAYKRKNKDGTTSVDATIHYEMLFRTSAKAKVGQVVFINSKLYRKAYDWLTIGLGSRLNIDDAKIVEMSAYAPLTTSTIVGTMHIPVQDILILKDKDSLFKTVANVVRAEEYLDSHAKIRKKCAVTPEIVEVKNTLWDGMGLIEASILPRWINGMALLRNHLFKMCGFKSHLQLFFRDWCAANGEDYNTYQVQDMFGEWHYVKDIKVITTDNAIKWRKFMNLMGNTPAEAYRYWCSRIKADGENWGIVKTDHQSKLGHMQQLSYQMINTLPCSPEDVADIARSSVEYVEKLKNDPAEFEAFLRKNANEVNHYEMLADLYRQNKDFGNSTYFRHEKSEIIKQYVYKLRKGKIFVNGDNLTVCGNPYALLLYSVGDFWRDDPTLQAEETAIQCYTRRFEDGEYLAAFRNPHNAPNNICHLHNVYSPEMKRYFEFSKNILAVNCIGTDIQDRANGMDFDSDFMLVTNQPTMVACAAKCYLEYPTIVNALKESGISYRNTKLDYAKMDSKFSKSRMGIGYSSNLAQLAMTYYWTETQKPDPDRQLLRELYDNFIILSVLAQVVIDSTKREYEVDANQEIERISNLPYMTKTREVIKNGRIKNVKYDFPEFMRYTREIKYTKDGKELPQEDVDNAKNKLRARINPELTCPMNWLEDVLDDIPNASTVRTIPTKDFFIKIDGDVNHKQMITITAAIEDYDNWIKAELSNPLFDWRDFNEGLMEQARIVEEKMKGLRVRNIATINRLIEIALGLSNERGQSVNRKYHPEKHTRKILNTLYKMDKTKFLSNFTSEASGNST